MSVYKVDDSVIDVVYDPIYGTVRPDGLVNKYCDTIEDMGKFRFEDADEVYKITISSTLILDELRARMVERRLKIRKVWYVQKGSPTIEIEVDDDARFRGYLPEGFCDHNENSLLRILYGEPKT